MIYDITKELFSVEVYPGDPKPEKKSWYSIVNGDACNLTEMKIGSHTGTHIDAPSHFVLNGKGVSEISLDKLVGRCQVIEWNGVIDDTFFGKKYNPEIKKVLLKGDVKIDIEAAKKITKLGFDLIGVEASTVGAPDKQKEVHRILLENEVVILENIDLSQINEGKFLLSALPLKMNGIDGSPVRAILMEE